MHSKMDGNGLWHRSLQNGTWHSIAHHDNVPPWDTWLAYIYEPKRDYLLSWVPREFVSLVTEGIKVSPEQPFQWLDLLDLELTTLLKHRRIIG